MAIEAVVQSDKPFYLLDFLKKLRFSSQRTV